MVWSSHAQVVAFSTSNPAGTRKSADLGRSSFTLTFDSMRSSLKVTGPSCRSERPTTYQKPSRLMSPYGSTVCLRAALAPMER